DLGELDVAALDRRLEDRRELLARAAPLRPEVDHDRPLGRPRDHVLLPRLLGDVHLTPSNAFDRSRLPAAPAGEPARGASPGGERPFRNGSRRGGGRLRQLGDDSSTGWPGGRRPAAPRRPAPRPHPPPPRPGAPPPGAAPVPPAAARRRAAPRPGPASRRRAPAPRRPAPGAGTARTPALRRHGAALPPRLSGK